MELDRLAGCGLLIPTASGAVTLDLLTCFVNCAVRNWPAVVLLDRLLNVVDDTDVTELLFRIKGSDNPTGRLSSSVDFSNLLSNSSTLVSANSGTSAKVRNKEKVIAKNVKQQRTS
jgi:hypothetical protein